MRTDDPVILHRLEEIEQACAGLRQACGFPTLNAITNKSTYVTYQCPHCTYGAYYRDDLDAHLEIEHPDIDHPELQGVA